MNMVNGTDSATHFLMEEFTRRVRVNPRYSLRAYARALGMSPGALSEVLRERRPLSLKAAEKVIKALGLTGLEADKLYSFVEQEKRKGVADIPEHTPDQKKLDEDTFHLIAQWYHFAILNLIDCEGFIWRDTYISKRLGLGVTEAAMAMKLLLRLGLVKKKGNGVECAHDYVLSPSDIPSAAVRGYHRQILGKAIDALELQSISERDITGIGFAADKELLPQIKKEISDFQDRISAKYSRGKKSEVYFLETALFKLSQGGNDGHE